MSMKPIRATSFMALAAVAAGLGLAAPAGRAEPFEVRTVTMDGMSGPAYYSRAAGAFRFLTRDAHPGQMASLATRQP